MSDPFNSLISTGASPVLFAASNMAGQYRQRNDFLEEQRQSRNQNMMQFIMQQGEASRQNQQQDRQFQLQYAQGERAMSQQREHNAFARLAASLDTHLKMVELESKDRQQAFENALRSQQVDLQTRMQGMQLKQIELTMRGQEGKAAFMRASVAAAIDPLNYDKHINLLADVVKEYGDGLAALGPEGMEIIHNINGQIQAKNQRPTVPKISDQFIAGETFNEGEAIDLLRKTNLSSPAGRMNADTVQVIGYFVNEASELKPNEDLVAQAAVDLFPDTHPNDLGSEQRALAQVVAAAGQPGASDGVRELATKLVSDPVAQAKFQTLHASGALNPITSKDQLFRLAAHDQARLAMIGELQAASRGRFLILPDDDRDALFEQWEEERLNILSGGNAAAKSALGGATEWEHARKVMRGQIQNASGTSSRTAMDWFDTLTGIPSAYNDTKKIFQGRAGELGVGDWANLGLTAATFIPAVGWIGRGLVTAGRGARLAGLAGRAGAVGLRGASATGMRLGTKGALQAVRSGTRQATAGALNRNVAAAMGREATKGGVNLGLAWGGVKRAAGGVGELAARSILPQAAVRGGYGLATGTSQFRELSIAEREVGDTIKRIKGYDGKVSGKAVDELAMKLDNYISVAGKYFPDGQVPATIEQNMLNVRALLPTYVWNRLKRHALMEGRVTGGGGYGASGDDPLTRLMQKYGLSSGYSASGALPVSPATGGLPGFDADDQP
jgi:hypothetical protein